MINLFTITPLLFFIITSYFYNNSKSSESTSYIVTVSLLEAFLSYFVIAVLFLQGFISIFYLLLIIIIILLPATALILISIKGTEWKADLLEVETIKNNIVLFSKTFLPFYVFLTVFRFLPLYFQIPLALLISALIYLAAPIVHKLLSPIYNKITTFFSMIGIKEFFILWITVVLLLIISALFQFPSNLISESFNLSNNVKYLDVDGFPANINNNFEQKEILQIESNISIDSDILDYYYTDTNLYIYTDTNRLIMYNLADQEIIFDEIIENGTVLDDENSVYEGRIFSRFISYDGYLILFGNKDTFLINNDSVTLISSLSNFYDMYYYLDDELYFLNDMQTSIQNIYKFEDGELNIVQTFDINIEKHEGLLVISESLFYQKSNEYFLFENPDISFEIVRGLPLYDSEKQIMYYSFSYYYSTEHTKVSANKDVETLIIQREHNTIGILINDKIYYTATDETNESRVEIVNDNFEIIAIYNHLELQRLWITNFYSNSYISNYHEEDNTLEFLQVDNNTKELVLTLYQLEERDTSMNLPFYTHYGIGIFISMTFFFLLPKTNHQYNYAESGFYEMTKKLDSGPKDYI